MITVKFCVWAISASIDMETTFLSLFEVVEHLNLPTIPSALTETKLVTIFERDVKKDPAIVDCTLVITNNRQKIGEKPFRIDFKETKRNRLVMRLPMLRIEEAGEYSFSFFHKKKRIGGYSVEVVSLNSNPSQTSSLAK